jgi:hypothetical protein
MNTYEKPALTDYGTLVELTAANGCVNPTDVLKGLPGHAVPLSSEPQCP